jgi:hypothetical protein
MKTIAMMRMTTASETNIWHDGVVGNVWHPVEAARWSLLPSR